MKGFTLIELLVVVSILLVISGGVILNYNDYNSTQLLKQTALTVKSNLRLAQSKALAGLKSAACTGTLNGYDVQFVNTTTYTMNEDCTSGSQAALSVSLPSGITFSPAPPTVTFRAVGQGVAINNDVGGMASATIALTAFGKIYHVQVYRNGDIKDVGFISTID